MTKDKYSIIDDFNKFVNMTPSELENWLKGEDSIGAGWKKDPNSEETIGHESGRKIVEILKNNPNKDPEKYSENDLNHMKKVVSYCKRHLAQEKSQKNNPDSKSYKSLKNWGHDPLKK